MVGMAVRDLWGVSDTRSEDKSGIGTDSAAEVPVALGVVSWSDAAGAIGTAKTAVASWVAGETIGRKRTGAGAMSGCRSSGGENLGASCAAWVVVSGDPFTANPRRGGRSVLGPSASS